MEGDVEGVSIPHFAKKLKQMVLKARREEFHTLLFSWEF